MSRKEFETLRPSLVRLSHTVANVHLGAMGATVTDVYDTGDGRWVIHEHAMGGESFYVVAPSDATTAIHVGDIR